ncbi:MAG: UPF0175 family protein [Bacillota bacterium]
MRVVRQIELPEEILLALRQGGDEFIKEMKRTIAVKYYAEKKLSLGQSAELAEMSKEEFIKFLGKSNVSIFHYDTKAELLEDITNA